MTSSSPDNPGVIDLTLLDEDAQTLIDQALTDAATKLPEWVPREGHTEVVLLESTALIDAEVIYAVNRLPGAVLTALLGLYGLEQDPGAPPVASFTFATSAAGDVTVPAGTRLRILYDDDTAAVDFLTDTDLLIAAGTGSGTVTGTGQDNTTAVNGTPTGAVELVDAVAAIDTVTLAGQVTGGIDPETVEAYQDRGANLFRRLVSTLVLPEHFTAAALEQTYVTRATTLDLYDPSAGGAPGDNPGHVTVAAAGAGGTALAAADATSLTSDLESKALASLTIHVIAPTVTPVDVDVTITLTAGSVTADVEQAVTDALTSYLDPDAWEWGGTVYRNELIALVDNVAGVDRVVDIATPAADVVLAGDAPLAAAGALTVTVQ